MVNLIWVVFGWLFVLLSIEKCDRLQGIGQAEAALIPV